MKAKGRQRPTRPGGYWAGDFAPSATQVAPLVPLGLCPNVPGPCGRCWYCLQREATR